MFWQFPGEFCRQRVAAAEAATAATAATTATAGPRHVSYEVALVSPIPGHKTNQMSSASLHISYQMLLSDVTGR